MILTAWASTKSPASIEITPHGWCSSAAASATATPCRSRVTIFKSVRWFRLNVFSGPGVVATIKSIMLRWRFGRVRPLVTRYGGTRAGASNPCWLRTVMFTRMSAVGVERQVPSRNDYRDVVSAPVADSQMHGNVISGRQVCNRYEAESPFRHFGLDVGTWSIQHVLVVM